ncbi:MAG: iron-containing alcohol dehydrogenase [Halieaceae bacterium]|jgi:alcohol dehydrogenase class IV|nr:iron-containing alcohol dehydrogenase [Halieaceae bacterium]
MSDQHLGGNWNYPNSITAGAGTVAQLSDAAIQMGMRAPLVVTDPALAALPMIAAALERCGAAGLNAGLFSQVRANPTGQTIIDGVQAYRAGGHDGVIGFGGGSSIDVAKAVALMVGQDCPLWEFEDRGDNWRRANEAEIAAIIAVPTTAGTGSEVGRAAVIIDDAHQVKKIIFHPNMLPSRVILDPELTLELPPSLTAATGMDALSHNLEALCSPSYHPMAQGIAVEGIRLIKEHLPEAVANGHNLEARMQMLVASSMGATAFQKGLGAMHALAHPLGALFDAHHGLLNAILMPYVLQANRDEIQASIERTARYIGLDNATFDGFLNWVLALRRQVGIPHSLNAIGIDDSQLDKVGKMATEDPSAGGNPIAFTAAQYAQLCGCAIRGELAS